MPNPSFRVHKELRALEDAFWEGVNALPEGAKDLRDPLYASLARFSLVGAEARAASKALKSNEPHWLFIYGRDSDDNLTVATIPKSAIEERQLELLERENGRRVAVVFGETSYDAPEHWEIWTRFVLGVGLHGADAFACDIEIREREGLVEPAVATLDRWSGSWTKHVAVGAGGADVTRLDVSIDGVVFLHEMM